MVMPKIEREAEARNYGKFTISPLGGYGVTLAHCAAPVSLENAISSIRIMDVLHEL
jgi:DNA-directed RNA polymerase subunit alpha